MIFILGINKPIGSVLSINKNEFSYGAECFARLQNCAKNYVFMIKLWKIAVEKIIKPSF